MLKWTEDVVINCLVRGLPRSLYTLNGMLKLLPNRSDYTSWPRMGSWHRLRLVGAFGEQVQRTAKEFVKCGLVQVVASDAHTLKNRGFVMTKAYQVLNEMDSQYPERFVTNARNLLNGDKIKARRIEVPRKQRKHWLS